MRSIFLENWLLTVLKIVRRNADTNKIQKSERQKIGREMSNTNREEIILKQIIININLFRANIILISGE